MNLRSVILIFPLFFFNLLVINSQTPSKLNIDKNFISEKIGSSCANEAGSVGFGAFKGNSISTSFERIILCFGDTLEIKHNRDFNLSDDPNKLTDPGIAYALYTCPPESAFSGPGISNISMDPCLNKLPKYGNQSLTDSFWIVSDKINGDLTLFNQGQLQDSFNQGKPIQVWFAPITLDDFNNRKIEPGSSCTKVNTSAAFSVIYLNDISAVALPSSCQNSLVIKGGLPEFDSTLNYVVDIYLKNDISVKGTLANFAGHGDTLQFIVPQPGDYIVQISDQTGCVKIIDFNVSNCAALFIDLPQKNVAQNSNFCVPVKVRNFNEILSIQFALQWDSSVLRFVGFNIPTPSILPNLSAAGFATFGNSINFSWNDASLIGISIPDSSIIFDLCFTAVGKLDECSPIKIIEKSDFPIEVVDTTNLQIGLIAAPGEICISNSPLFLQTTIKPVGCRGENTGGVEVKILGGFPPYQLDFDGNTNSIFNEGGILNYTSLLAGFYDLNVQDNQGNRRTVSISIPEGIEMEISTDVFSPTCFGGNDAKIIPDVKINGVQESPSSGIFAFTWSSGLDDWEQTQLKSGTYQLTITHQNGCIQKHVTNISDPVRLRIDSIISVSPTCIGFPDGRIFSYLSGGSKPYSYQLKGEGKNVKLSANVFSGLFKGEYELTYTDSLGCEELKDTIQVIDPPGIKIEFSNIQAVSCPLDKNDGQATVTAEYEDKKTGSFIFNWINSGQIDRNVIFSRGLNLGSGFQQVVVADANNCAAFDSVFIPAPSAISIANEFVQPTCHNSSDGSITAIPQGGTPGYSILWNHSGEQLFTVGNLAVGNYTAEVTDANGCLHRENIFLSGPAELQLVVDINNTKDASCFGGKDGQLAVVYNSNDPINPVGNAPYQWSGAIGGSSIPIASGLSAGEYKVTVTDIKGCKDSLEYIIQEPLPLEAEVEITEPALCFGDPSVLEIQNITGGNGNYSFTVSGSSLIYDSKQKAYVFDGNYEVTVLDQKGCFYKELISVTGPDSFSVNFNPSTIILSLGDLSTSLKPIISNSTPLATFQWSPSKGLSDPMSEQPIVLITEDQKYELVVTDINGCESSGTVFVEVNKARKIFLPNVFSPNGDGINDEFMLFGCQGIQSVNNFMIFDRWGDLLHKLDQFNTPDCNSGLSIWDGKIGDQPVPEGSYVYAIEVTFIDGVTLTFKGELTLMQ